MAHAQSCRELLLPEFSSCLSSFVFSFFFTLCRDVSGHFLQSSTDISLLEGNPLTEESGVFEERLSILTFDEVFNFDLGEETGPLLFGDAGEDELISESLVDENRLSFPTA